MRGSAGCEEACAHAELADVVYDLLVWAQTARKSAARPAHWRYHDRLGYAAIVDRLNAAPDAYPPPIPPGGAARARGAWGKSAIADLLRNPKYTGYQVFNRRASRSRSGAPNDPALWVWSPQPVHEPLIPKCVRRLHPEAVGQPRLPGRERHQHPSSDEPHLRATRHAPARL
ncbi:recombinase family protein [Streptomyces sp. 3213.3]|uniref:recombinase family protein n=1 Tax=Streptomyces sp. 3213.3 TaxID=1855348 RepID=UPI0013595603|nr:recombinase family protein [Streptomyces sp. 3213.3]